MEKKRTLILVHLPAHVVRLVTDIEGLLREAEVTGPSSY